MPIIEPSPASPSSVSARRFALWQLGFRPFYALASLFAALSIAAWAAQVAGWLGRPYLAGPLWHGHEMVFGFALAVIVGFLLTAVRNWAQQPTPTGPVLAALVVLWLAGRLLVTTPFNVAAAVIGPIFPLACAAAIAVPLARAGNRRNYFFVAVLVAIAGADAAFHLSMLGVLNVAPALEVRVALDLVLIVMAAMAGRVIPMFTNNGVPGAGAVGIPALDKTALALLAALAIADAAGMQGTATGVLAVCAAVAHGVRWLLWRPWKTLRAPLVWSLHVAYAWIPVHLALRAAVAWGWAGGSAATHALTVGAIGGLTTAMMTRTALGHTGRPLAAHRSEVAIYLLVLAAAVVRVVVPVAVEQWAVRAIDVSACLWSAAFLLYLFRYGPMLLRPRIDSKPG